MHWKLTGVVLAASLLAPVDARSGDDQASVLLGQAVDAEAAGDPAAAAALLEQTIHQLWVRFPMAVATAVLVEAPAEGYGRYLLRESNLYRAGEPIVIYVEPIGYDHASNGQLYRFVIDAHLQIVAADGSVVAEVKGHPALNSWSHNPNRELFFNLQYRVNDAPPGRYFLRTALHDRYGNGMATFDKQVMIVAD